MLPKFVSLWTIKDPSLTCAWNALHLHEIIINLKLALSIENLHGLQNLLCYYEDAEDPEWWKIFTADPHGDPDGHFNYLKH